MATFYPQVLSNKSLSQQWQTYLQNKPIINNIEDIIKTQTKDYKEIIKNSSEQQIHAIQQSTNAICGTYESGIEMISDHLQELSYGIDELRSELNKLSSMLDWKLSLIIEQQRMTNILLGNIALLLRIPDIQKERQYHIKQGVKFLKNAFLDADFYDDALKNFLKAVTIENSDFFALHRIGLIYMYSPKHMDLNKSEEYFRKAAKYAVAEINSSASLTTKYLVADTDTDFSNIQSSNNSIKVQAAESFMFGGRICYIQGKFGEAADLAGSSFSIVPNMVEAGFTKVKALSANNKNTEAATVLETVIRKDRYFSIKTISDLDLIQKPEILKVLEEMRKEAFDNATKLLSKCKSNIIYDSIVKEELDKIDELVNKKGFLQCKKAIDLIDKNQSRMFLDISLSGNNNNGKRKYNEILLAIIALIREVQYPKSYVPKIISLFTYLTKNTQLDFSKVRVSNDLLFNIEYDVKTMNSSLISFIHKEKEYFNNLPFVLVYMEKIIQEINNEDNIRIQEGKLLEQKMIQRGKLIEQNRKVDEEIRQTERQTERNWFSFRFALFLIFPGVFFGLIFGVIIGFFRSLNFDPNSSDFFYPGVFQETLIILMIIGGIIGAIVGIISGQSD